MLDASIHGKLFLLAMGLFAGSPSACAQERFSEGEIKAAYIFNFMQFIEWPHTEARASKDWIICVSPFSSFKRNLLGLESRPARDGTPIRIKLWEHNEFADCRMLVLQGSDIERAAMALRALEGKTPVLTIADEPTGLPAEIMISLHRDAGRIVFNVNSESIARAGMSVSSRLLRLSKNSR